MAAYEAPTPKYLRVLNTLRERIEDGTYTPGAALPSESQLIAEFGVSRNSVLRALGILRQDGWIESHQGRGHFARGKVPTGRNWPRYAREALDVDESAQVEMLHTGPVLASARVAGLLKIPEGTPVYERRRVTQGERGPLDLVATFMPVDIAVGTDFIKPAVINEGLLAHIEKRKGLRGDYAEEMLTARRATADEAKLLAIGEGDPVISIVITLLQASGDPIMVSDIVMPGARHELADAYPIS